MRIGGEINVDKSHFKVVNQILIYVYISHTSAISPSSKAVQILA